MSHCDEGALVALLDGEIPSNELGPIQHHLDGCAECRAQLEEVRRFKQEALDLIGSIEVPEPALVAAPTPVYSMAAAPARPISAPARIDRKRRWTAGLAWAATIVVAVAIGYSAANIRGDRQVTAAFQPAPAPAVAQPADRPATPPPAPLPTPILAAPKAASADSRGRATERRAEPAQLGRLRAVAGKESFRDSAPRPASPMAAASAEEREADVEKDRARNEATLKRRPARLLTDSSFRLDELVTAGVRAKEAPVAIVSADSAIKTLGGSIKLVDGLVAEHYEQQGPVVRVVYRLPWGPLVLEQRRLETGLQFQLIPPSGAPADSVIAWRQRIK